MCHSGGASAVLNTSALTCTRLWTSARVATVALPADRNQPRGGRSKNGTLHALRHPQDSNLRTSGFNRVLCHLS